MTDYLRIFEAKALAEELTKAGHSISERTAQRWKAGDTKPKPQDIRAIRRLVGATLPQTTQKALMPEWAQGLEDRLRKELRLNRALIESDESEETRQEIERMRAELHGLEPGEPLPDVARPMADPHHPGTARGSVR